jgi:hypothetical protein
MYPEIASALAGIKTVSELVTLTLKLKVDSAVTEKAVESQSAIISLQSAVLGVQVQNQELLEENKNLKQKLIDTEKWDEEAQKYTLAKVGGYDSLAYVLKPEYKDTAPEHWLCIYCYEEKRKSMLQRSGSKEGRALFTCGRCPAEIMD